MAAYDDYDYPKYWAGREYEHASEEIVLKTFFKKIGKNKKIIDVGGGYGRLAKVYDSYSKETTLAEPSKSLLIRAKDYLKGTKAKKLYVHAPLNKLPKIVKNKKYDVVVLVRVMHHIDDPKEAIEVASKLLPKGGYFVLEFANKLHGKAVLRNFISGNFTFPLDIFPVDKRSKKNITKNSILFLNHHPDIINQELNNYGFKIMQKRSVSNIRSKRIKTSLPLNTVLWIEKILQKPLAKINFGPSIFILARKK